MNGGEIGSVEIVSMLRAACAGILRDEARLTELDSVCGDGDHGATMARAARGILDGLGEGVDTPAAVFSKAGQAFMSVDGGASRALLTSFFLGAAQGCAGKAALEAEDLARALEAGLAGVRRYSKAREGDKSLMDALEPAVRAVRESARDGTEAGLKNAAAAALQGAENTAQLQAKLGRAQHLGARTIGYKDPGATTIALLFDGFYKGLIDG